MSHRHVRLGQSLLITAVILLSVSVVQSQEEVGSEPSATTGIRLAVPFIHQYFADPKANDCGPASLAMVIEAYNKRPAEYVGKDKEFLKDIRDKTSKPNFSDYTDFDDLKSVLDHEKYQLKYEVIDRTNSTLQQIKDAIKHRKPVITLINSNDPALNRNYGGHWIVVIGFSRDGRYVFVNDPDLRLSNKPNWNKDTPGGQVRWPVHLFQQALMSAGHKHSAIIVGDGLAESAVLPPVIGEIRGFVTDETSVPVQQATVIIASDQVVNKVTKTDFAGRYIFQDLPPGKVTVVAIKGQKGGTADIVVGRHNPTEPLTITIRTPTLSQIITPASGRVTAKFVSTGSPGDQTGCSGDFGQQAPVQRTIYPGYLYYAGVPELLGVIPANTELLFWLTPSGFCRGSTFLSTDPNRALILHPNPSNWIIAWEDYIDADFNDLVVRIELQPQPLPFLSLPFAVNENTEQFPLSLVERYFDHQYPTGLNAPNNRVAYYVTHNGHDSQIDGTDAPVLASYDGNEGTDFRISPKTPVWAAAPGTVLFVGNASISCAPKRGASQSTVVKVQHENGFVTEYWGLEIAHGIVAGSTVEASANTPLGVATTSPCTGNKGLHFVVRNPAGFPVDPFGWKPSPLSAWYGIDDPWRQYQNLQDQDAASHYLWLYSQEVSKLLSPSQTTVLTTSNQQIKVTVPSGAFAGPTRLSLEEIGSLVPNHSIIPLRGLSVTGFTVNDVIVLTSQRPLQIEMSLPISESSTSDAAISNFLPPSPQFYLLDRSSGTIVWQPIPTTWDATTKQARATTTNLGTFVLALKAYPVFLPVVVR